MSFSPFVWVGDAGHYGSGGVRWCRMLVSRGRIDKLAGR